MHFLLINYQIIDQIISALVQCGHSFLAWCLSPRLLAAAIAKCGMSNLMTVSYCREEVETVVSSCGLCSLTRLTTPSHIISQTMPVTSWQKKHSYAMLLLWVMLMTAVLFELSSCDNLYILPPSTIYLNCHATSTLLHIKLRVTGKRIERSRARWRLNADKSWTFTIWSMKWLFDHSN